MQKIETELARGRYMFEITRNRHERDDIKKNDLFSDDQIDGIEMGWGEDEEFGDESL